jgi:hypothetical protein
LGISAERKGIAECKVAHLDWSTVQRTKIIEAQATIPPCQLPGNFANWRAKICARTIARAKNRHEFSEDFDDFRNGLLSQQRQLRRSIFFIIFFNDHFVLLYGFVLLKWRLREIKLDSMNIVVLSLLQ